MGALINKQEDRFSVLMQNLICQQGTISSIARMSTLEELIKSAKSSAELGQLEPVIRRLQVVKKSRVQKKANKVSHLPGEINRIVEIFENKKASLKAGGKLPKQSLKPADCLSRNIDEFIWNFFSMEKAYRSNFLKASNEIEFSFQEWRRGYVSTQGRSKVLKKFFEQKMEQSAQNPCDYIYLYGAVSGRREECIQKIKSFNFSWDDIARKCRKDPYLKNEMPVNELLEAIKGRLDAEN
ncbi:MAG: hypothetical protein WC470_03420 [Candidatus Paceibacterota bacterium]